MVERRVVRRVRWSGYALGSAGLGIAGAPTGLLLLFYLTNIAGMRAGLAGVAIALPKIWDAIVDPVVGSWADRLAARTGRRAPFLLISGLVYAAALFLMLSLPSLPSPWMVAGFATLVLMAASTAQTIFGVCQLSMANEMESEPTGLSGLLSFSGIVAGLLAVVATLLTPHLISWSGGGRAGYSRMAAQMAVVSALLLLAFAGMTRRVPARAVASDADSLSLFASYRATVANRSFYCLIAYFVVFGSGIAILQSLIPFANLYVLHGDQSSLALMGSVASATSIAGMPLAPLLVRWLGMMRGLRIGNVVCAAAYGSLFLTSFGAPWANWVAAGGIGLCNGVLTLVLQTALLSVMKLPLKNGLVVPAGFYLGVVLFGTKLGLSAGAFAAGELLDVIGFVSGSTHQAAATVMWLRLSYTLVPAVFFLASGLFLNRVRADDVGAPERMLLGASE